MSNDYVLTGDPSTGKITWHRHGCLAVETARLANWPLVTMFDGRLSLRALQAKLATEYALDYPERPAPDFLHYHDCLEEEMRMQEELDGLSREEVGEALEELKGMGIVQSYTDRNGDIRYVTTKRRQELEDVLVLCPRCERNMFTPYGAPVPQGRNISEFAPPPALSRMDNETYICSPCGQDEAMRDFTGAPPIPPSEWPIRRNPEFGVGGYTPKPKGDE